MAAPAPAKLAGPKPWYVLGAENTEAICAGVIAGGALMGIALAVLGVLVLPDVAELGKVGESVMKAIGPR